MAKRHMCKKALQDIYALRNPPRCNVDCGEIILETNTEAVLEHLADEPIHLVRNYEGALESLTEDEVDYEIEFYE